MTVSVSTGKINLGLERIVHFLEHILPEDPRAKLRVVHVAGTNGKGSVCALVSEAAVAAGYKVGIFNSPHFLEPNDAVRIQNQPISATEYAELRAWIVSLDTAAQAPDGPLTLFEQTTVAAIWWFAKHDVDLAVIEVGMGGLRDATNVFGLADGQSSPLGVGRSLVQCICPVDEDHLGVIGNNVGEIACEKAGIMRPGSWIIIAHQKNQDALYQIRTLAHHNSSESIVNVHLMPYPEAHVAGFSIKHPDDNGDRSTSSALPIVRCPPTVPRWGKFNSASQRCLQLKYPPLLDTFTKSRQSSPSDNATISAAAAPTVSAPDIAPMSIKLDLPLVLPGSYQAGNACVAFYALDALRRYYGYDKLTDAAIQTGFQNTYWPGRLSWLALDRVPLHSPKASAPPPLADDRASVATSRPLAATAGRKPSPSSCSSTGSSRSSYSSSLSGAFSAADRLGTWVLADGAHNRAAATELRNYVDTTLRRYASDNFIYNQASGIFLGSPPVRWIVGFSHGKDMTAILKNLVHPGDILWLVPFSQPSEMPWISCVATDGIYSAAQKLPYFDKIDVVQFDSLASVLGRLTSDFTDSHLNVLCGSLYLVADLYRELKVRPFDAPSA